MVALLKIITMALYSILPNSPFRGVADTIREFDFLPYLNWIIPFDTCTVLTATWCLALLLYYNFSFVKKLFDRVKDKIF